MKIWKEMYQELKHKALSADATQEDINLLGKWFELYGESYWNGEFYDVDGTHQLRPVDVEDEDGDYHREGWELR